MLSVIHKLVHLEVSDKGHIMNSLIQMEERKRMLLAVSKGQLVVWNLTEMPSASYRSSFHSDLATWVAPGTTGSWAQVRANLKLQISVFSTKQYENTRLASTFRSLQLLSHKNQHLLKRLQQNSTVDPELCQNKQAFHPPLKLNLSQVSFMPIACLP